MFDPFDPQAQTLLRRLNRARRQAGLVLFYERLSAALWRMFSWILLFAGLWLFEIPDLLGQSGRIGAFMLFLGGVIYFLRDLKNFRLPATADIDQRIESDSHLKHRPINALTDALANPLKPESRSLWEISKQRALKMLQGLKPVFPQGMLAAKDPLAVRMAVLMFFCVGLVIAGADWQARIGHGLVPFDLSGAKKTGAQLRIIITPPAYTGMAQLILEKSAPEILEIPEGSMMKATVHGGLGQPYLSIDGENLPFESVGDGNYITEMAVPRGSTLAIKQFFIARAAWHYTLVTDTAPEITVSSKPEIVPDSQMQFTAKIKDDYGIRTLTMRMEASEDMGAPPVGNPVAETRSVMSPPGAEVEIKPVYDLTAHTWAGLPVKMTFEALDGMNHKTATAPMTVTLPERKFTHPVAKELIALRKKLAWNPTHGYQEIRDKLESLIVKPQTFSNDFVTALALRSASSRLYWARPSVKISEEVIALLWDTALQLEDGNLSIAARNLKSAQQDLENALNNPDINQEQIAELMDNLRNAMAQYFMEIQRELQKRIANGEPLPVLPPDMLSKIIDPDMLAQMLNEMESDMRTGDRKSAQEMLSQLHDMMDKLNPSMAPLPKDIKDMMETSKDLQKLIESQQLLLDQTAALVPKALQPDLSLKDYGRALPQNRKLLEQWGTGDMPPPPQAKAPPSTPSPQVDTRDKQKEQEGLRYILGQMMMKAGDAFDEVPENLGQAELEMRGSSKELGDNNPDESVPYQEKTIEYLKQAKKGMSQKIMEKLKRITGLAFGGSGLKYDPLGRPYGADGEEEGPFHGSNVKIPDEAERKRAQEILRLLQQRAGEFDRPEQELEYYRRLLRQF